MKITYIMYVCMYDVCMYVYICMYIYIYPSCFPRVSWTICYSSLKTCLPTNTEKDSERIELRLHVYIPPPLPPLLHTCFLFETSVNHYTDFTIQHVCPTCSNLIMTPENKRILTYWTTGMDRKSKLVWCEELWMQTHSTRCQDLTPRPGRSARNSEGGSAPVNIYSIWRARVKGYHGSDYSNSRSVWADEQEGQGLWERWKNYGKQPDDQIRTQTVCLDALLFITGWYWVGINVPSRNHTQMNRPDYS